MEEKRYDIIIAGGGAAGLSLATALVNPRYQLNNMKILLIEKDVAKQNDRTWCYWSNTSETWDSIVAHSWDTLALHYGNESNYYALHDYKYRMVKAIDLYRAADKILGKAPSVTRVYGSIDSIFQDKQCAYAIVDGKTFRCTWLFDSIFEPRQLLVGADKRTLTLQHFYGYTITTPYNAFEDSVATFFDFRDTNSLMQFFYVLPTGPRQALVECTEFSKQPQPPEYFIPLLKRYIKTQLKIETFDIESEEYGVIPMMASRFSRRIGRHILSIGTKGGMVKPSTGYAFKRIQHDSHNIATSLQRTGTPFNIPRPKYRFIRTDGILINVINTYPQRSQLIFFNLFKRNTISRIFKLLDEELPLHSLIALMSTVPWRLFIIGFIKTILHLRYRQHHMLYTKPTKEDE